MPNQMTDDARRSVIEQALASVPTGAAREPLKWRSGELVLDIVEIDINAVLLNPHSHRIRSLLQSLADGGESVSQDPFGVESQQLIASLLRSTEGFPNILNALERDGQAHAGAITRAGVLVNANTRTVALRDLHQGTGPAYVKVVVLPADATEIEITLLELELQMERDVKQEYSFTARLLFIEELMTKLGMTALQVGQRLRPDLTNSRADQKKARDEIELELRLLSMIRQVISHSGGSMTLRDFDGWRQGLIEIDSDYQALRLIRPEIATRVREAQLAGLMAGVDYRRLREVDSELLETYVLPALAEQPVLKRFATVTSRKVLPASGVATGDPIGLEVLDLLEDSPDDAGQATKALGEIYALLAKAPEDGDVALPAVGDGPSLVLPRKTLAAGLKSTLETAIAAKKRDNRQLDALTAPYQYLREAAKSLDDARLAWLEVSGRHNFQSKEFVAAREEVRRAHDELDQTIDGHG